MTEDELKLVAGCLVSGFLAGVIVGGLTSLWWSQRVFTTEAVQHGAAEWKVNADGSTEFRWLKQSAERGE